AMPHIVPVSGPPSIAVVEMPRAYYREAGTGPAVMCLHASASSSAQWRPLMERLGGRFRTLAVDLYGSGKSPRWPDERPLSLADEVSQLAPILESAGERVHLIGHSYGGAVALKTALRHPERIRSVILFEPVLFSLLFAEDPARPAAREITAVRDETIAAVARGAGSASGERFVDYWMGAGAWAGIPEPRQDPVAAAMSGVAGQVRGILGAGMAVPLPDGIGFPRLIARRRAAALEGAPARHRDRDRRRRSHGPGDASGPNQHADRAIPGVRS